MDSKSESLNWKETEDSALSRHQTAYVCEEREGNTLFDKGVMWY